jgi:hypothetical protein
MTRRHIPEETNPKLRRCENLETHEIYDKTSNCTEQVHASELIAQACSTRSLQEMFGPRSSVLLPAETFLLRKRSSNSFPIKDVIESRSNFENLCARLFRGAYITLLIDFVKTCQK